MSIDAFTDLERFRLPPAQPETQGQSKLAVKTAQVKTKRIKGEFLKGPIPLGWLGCAAKLSGKAPLTVALAIWFQAGRRRSKEVSLTTAVIERFGIDRKAKYRGLSALEKAGLVQVRRRPRKNPVVTILDQAEKPPSFEDDGCGPVISMGKSGSSSTSKIGGT